MNEQQEQPDFEEVFTVTSYYDGPRQGVANLHGVPHFFDCIFSDEQDDYSDCYRLTSVSEADLDLAREDWAIFKRWELAFHMGETSIETHPALPIERARHEELKRILGANLKTNYMSCILRTGLFKATNAPDLPSGVLRPMRVKWVEETSSHTLT